MRTELCFGVGLWAWDTALVVWEHACSGPTCPTQDSLHLQQIG
jgi:hypothetical protein